MEEYMLPCLNKELFGVDCLGCGFQRSFLFLIKGDFSEAFKMYPAIFTLILLSAFALVNWKVKFKKGKLINKILIAINVLVIVVSYFIKMNQLL